MINYHNLESCMHKIGDKHPDLLGIKRSLNFSRRVEISDISSGYDFCAKTQTALTQFQQSKGLSQTGRMNIETWRAIGNEINAFQFEMMFGRSPNAGALRNVIYAHKFRKMFPTESHTKLIRYAFLGGEKGGGGLSLAEVEAIDYGSKLTDTHFGTGEWYDIPITLLINEAYKHAMTPEGMSVKDAMEAAHKWIEATTKVARTYQKSADERNWRSNLREVMDSEALTHFGKACHTYMDSVSPAHHGWQEYRMPKYKDIPDIPRFLLEAYNHGNEESLPPTSEQRETATLYMRGAFLTTFGDRWFGMAVKDNGERKKVYDFLTANGLSWDQDLIPSNVIDSPLPVRPRGINPQTPQIGTATWT